MFVPATAGTNTQIEKLEIRVLIMKCWCCGVSGVFVLMIFAVFSVHFTSVIKTEEVFPKLQYFQAISKNLCKFPDK